MQWRKLYRGLYTDQDTGKLGGPLPSRAEDIPPYMDNLAYALMMWPLLIASADDWGRFLDDCQGVAVRIAPRVDGDIFIVPKLEAAMKHLEAAHWIGRYKTARGNCGVIWNWPMRQNYMKARTAEVPGPPYDLIAEEAKRRHLPSYAQARKSGAEMCTEHFIAFHQFCGRGCSFWAMYPEFSRRRMRGEEAEE